MEKIKITDQYIKSCIKESIHRLVNEGLADAIGNAKKIDSFVKSGWNAAPKLYVTNGSNSILFVPGKSYTLAQLNEEKDDAGIMTNDFESGPGDETSNGNATGGGQQNYSSSSSYSYQSGGQGGQNAQASQQAQAAAGAGSNVGNGSSGPIGQNASGGSLNTSSLGGDTDNGGGMPDEDTPDQGQEETGDANGKLFKIGVGYQRKSLTLTPYNTTPIIINGYTLKAGTAYTLKTGQEITINKAKFHIF